MKISKELLEKMEIYLRKQLPNEGCGYLMGTSDTIISFRSMRNRLLSPTAYEFEPREQFEALREARVLSLEIIGVFHSHPSGRAFPSQKDIELAHNSSYYHLIWSFHNSVECNLFSIQGDKVEQIPLEKEE